ncbi:MAG: site-specific integrase [Planctomycetota bacterium]
MHRKTSPKYRSQKSENGNRAFVELDGVRHYLGGYGTTESHQEYHRLLAEWNANGQQLPVAQCTITVVELLARFLEHAKTYYVKPDGTQTAEVSSFKQVIKLLKGMYGGRKVTDFGPLALKAVREQMIQMEWVRGHINKQVGRLKLIFRWGVAEELVHASVYQALLAVPGLKRGRSTAKESEPVMPAPEAHIEAVRPHVSPQVWAIIQLQLLTAARSGELVIMRPKDLNRSGSVWTYGPQDHKTAHFGHERTIYVGPRAQEILAPYLLSRGPEDYLFSPEEAEAKRRAKLHQQRKTPLSCGNRPGTNRVDEAKCKPGDHYTQESYRRAIQRACKKADVSSWHPHQLRHNAATRLRAEFGLEVAQIMLGHARADVTQLYAEANRAKALDTAVKVG